MERTLPGELTAPLPGTDWTELRLLNLVRAQLSPFDRASYTPEKSVPVKDKRTGKEKLLRFNLLDVIRWRFAPGEPSEEQRQQWAAMDYEPRDKGVPESNARIVTWSDGTRSLVIGARHFDIQPGKLEHKMLAVKHEDLLIMKQKIGKKAFIKPARQQPKPKRRESKAVRKAEEAKTKAIEDFLND